jgi:hypothetical protein
MAKRETAAEPEGPRMVRVQMLRTLRFHEGDRSMPRDVFGEQTVTGAQAIAWSLLEFAKPVEPWQPDPRDCHEAAVEAMRWMERERGRFVSDAEFERVPLNARRLRAIAKLVQDVNLGGDAA